MHFEFNALRASISGFMLAARQTVCYLLCGSGYPRSTLQYNRLNIMEVCHIPAPNVIRPPSERHRPKARVGRSLAGSFHVDTLHASSPRFSEETADDDNGDEDEDGNNPKEDEGARLVAALLVEVASVRLTRISRLKSSLLSLGHSQFSLGRWPSVGCQSFNLRLLQFDTLPHLLLPARRSPAMVLSPLQIVLFSQDHVYRPHNPACIPISVLTPGPLTYGHHNPC